MCGPTSTSTTAISRSPDPPGADRRPGRPLRILGIDPGSAITGYGVIEAEGGRLVLHDAGAIRMAHGADLPARLREAAAGLSEVVKASRPDEVCLESLFQHRNVRSVLVLAHLRGALLLDLARAGLPLHEYSPREVKKAVTGHGHADKEQVRAMVQRILGIPALPRPLDISDALAVAICHAHAAPVRRRWNRP